MITVSMNTAMHYSIGSARPGDAHTTQGVPMEYEATAPLYAWQRRLAAARLSIGAPHLRQWPDAYGWRRPIMRP